MKKLVYIFYMILIIACDSESALDCIQSSGPIIQKEVPVSSFNKIVVNRDIELIIKEGMDHKVVIESGENLINDVNAIVIENELQLYDDNTCNYVRKYGITKVYVTAPNIREIRNSSQYDVSSDGVLNYNSIRLLSEDFNAPGSFTVGDFRMEINSVDLSITANNISSFYISGEVENLFIGFFSGAGKFLGESLIAQNIEVYHRGSNDMIVYPIKSLTGELRGTGNLISRNNPPVVEITQLYTGQLIFEN